MCRASQNERRLYRRMCVWGGVCSRCKRYRKKVFQTSFPKRVIFFYVLWNEGMKTKMGTLHSDILSLGKLVHIHQIGKQVENPKYNYIFYVHYFLPRVSTGFCFVLLLTKQLGPTKIQNYDIKNLGLKQLSKLNDFLFFFSYLRRLMYFSQI